MVSRLQQATGVAPATQQRSPYEVFRIQINRLRKDIEAMIGKEKLDTFIRVCLNAVQHKPELLNADRKSLFIACMEAAQDGLMPDGNEAAFNVYGTKDPVKSKEQRRDVWVDQVQYLPMVYGIVQKIFESGAKRCDAVAVYEKDVFKYARGDAASIVHEPYIGDEEPGKLIAAYVIIEYPNLSPKREVMFRRDIEKVKDKSKAKNGLMWGDFYDQAAIKSVIHRVWKQLPKSAALTRALRHDNKATGIEGVDAVIPAEEAGSNLESLVDMRFEQEMRDGALGGGAAAGGQEVVEGAVTGKTEERADANPGAGTTTGGGGQKQPPAAAVSAGAGDPPPLPKQGDAGTSDQKDKFLRKMEDAKDLDTLGIVMDDTRFYSWSGEDAAAFATKYNERKNALSG